MKERAGKRPVMNLHIFHVSVFEPEASQLENAQTWGRRFAKKWSKRAHRTLLQEVVRVGTDDLQQTTRYKRASVANLTRARCKSPPVLFSTPQMRRQLKTNLTRRSRNEINGPTAGSNWEPSIQISKWALHKITYQSRHIFHMCNYQLVKSNIV